MQRRGSRLASSAESKNDEGQFTRPRRLGQQLPWDRVEALDGQAVGILPVVREDGYEEEKSRDSEDELDVRRHGERRRAVQTPVAVAVTPSENNKIQK